jgi:hypothetical protein
VIILGIDTGINGAAAVIDGGGSILDVIDTPTLGEDSHRIVDILKLDAWIKKWGVTHAAIERAVAMPPTGVGGARRTMGASSAMNFGDARGTLRSAIIMNRIPYRLIQAASWKRYYKLDRDKEASRLLAIRMWPEASKFMNRKKDHQRAEACLIAEFSRMTIWGLGLDRCA